MNQKNKVTNRKRKAEVAYYHSPWDIMSRALLASLGGYGIATLFTVSISLIESNNIGQNIIAATESSFLIMTAMVIWAFCAQTAVKGWLISVAIAGLLFLLCGVIYVS